MDIILQPLIDLIRYESWDSVSESAQLPQIMDMSILHNVEYSVRPLTDLDISKDLDYNVPVPKNEAVRVYDLASILDNSDYSVRSLIDLDISSELDFNVPLRKNSPIHQYNLKSMMDDSDYSARPLADLEISDKSLGIRHLQVALLFLGIATLFAMRVNLSVAIVAMIDKDSADDNFNWNEQTQSLLLSSFFWGYALSQIPGGQIAEKYGPKFVLLFSVSLCAIANIITPLCTSYGGWEALCALRVISGLSQGVFYPSVHTFLSKWAPLSERGPLATYCYCGAEFGIVVILSVSGVLASSSMRWPSIFYFSGAAALLWALIWWWFGSSTPAENSMISDIEKDYIEVSLRTTGEEKLKTKLPTPWRSILTSLPFLALTLTQSAHLWNQWTLLTKIPAYMKNILKFDLKESALLSALPYLVKLLLSIALSILAQFLHRKKYFSINFSRKFFNSIGQWIPAILIIGLGYISSDNAQFAVAIVTIAVGLNAAPYLGFQANHIDLAPNFAGTLMGTSNAVANVFSIVGPLIIGFIVTDETDPAQWRIIFYIAAAIYFIGNLMFVVFGRTSVQSWNEPKTKNDEST